MSSKTKKQRFYALIVPAVQKVHSDLMKQYAIVKKDLKRNKNSIKLILLKQTYGVQSNEELLRALKPHPPSIVIAQAAMESAWATSRFFQKAKNVFGVWSVKKNEPRIAALVKRGNNKTIWLRKFETVEESIKEYYKLIGKAKAYSTFRKVRYNSDDVYEMIKHLDKYSELGKQYTVELAKMIKYNNLQRYDK